MEAVLGHPVWWTPEERLSFLCRLSDFLAGTGRSALLHKLHAVCGSSVLGEAHSSAQMLRLPCRSAMSITAVPPRQAAIASSI